MRMAAFVTSVKWLLLIKLLIDLSQVPFVFVEKNREFFSSVIVIWFLYFFFLKKDLWTDTWQKQCLLLDSFFLVTLPPTCCFFYFPFLLSNHSKVRYLHSYQFVTEELVLTREFLLAFGVKTKISLSSVTVNIIYLLLHTCTSFKCYIGWLF